VVLTAPRGARMTIGSAPIWKTVPKRLDLAKRVRHQLRRANDHVIQATHEINTASTMHRTRQYKDARCIRSSTLTKS
jgi:hypothetical protein